MSCVCTFSVLIQLFQVVSFLLRPAKWRQRATQDCLRLNTLQESRRYTHLFWSDKDEHRKSGMFELLPLLWSFQGALSCICLCWEKGGWHFQNGENSSTLAAPSRLFSDGVIVCEKITFFILSNQMHPNCQWKNSPNSLEELYINPELDLKSALLKKHKPLI